MKHQIDRLLSHPDFKENEYWRRIKVDSDTKLIERGDNGHYFYLLESGLLRVLGKIDIDQTKSLNPGVFDVNPGGVVGELALFDNEPRSATVKTIEPSVLLEFDASLTMDFLQKHPDVGFEFMRGLMSVMVDRLRSSNQKVFSLLAWGLKAHGIEKEL